MLTFVTFVQPDKHYKYSTETSKYYMIIRTNECFALNNSKSDLVSDTTV